MSKESQSQLQYGSNNTPYVSKYEMDKKAPLGNPSPLSSMIESSVGNTTKLKVDNTQFKPNLIKGVSMKIGDALKGGVQALDKVVSSKGFNQFSQLAGTLNSAIPTMDKTINNTDTITGGIRDSINSSLMQGVAGP